MREHPQANPPAPPHTPPISRLAPSPTGALHLGNARTFLINWALARQRGWTLLLRIEDLDTPRVKPGVIDATIDTLAWLGIDWDGDPITQSRDATHHERAIRELARRSLVYPCALTRAQIEQAASAPHEGDHETRYDPSLRPDRRPASFEDRGTNWRLAIDPGPVAFDDMVRGALSRDPGAEIGDFVLWTKRGAPSYQLACAVDDARQGVTRIVRGDDLIGSTARQILVRRALGIDTDIQHAHLPLVRGDDARRLAKRHGDTRIDHYRAKGVPRDRVIGLLAYWSGITPDRTPMPPGAFRDAFDLDTLPRADTVFTPEDDQWLRS